MAPASTATSGELTSEADRQWGFQFGIDGLCGPEEAMRLMGIQSLYTLNQRARDGQIRKGKAPNNHSNVYCRHSVRCYISECAANEV